MSRLKYDTDRRYRRTYLAQRALPALESVLRSLDSGSPAIPMRGDGCHTFQEPICCFLSIDPENTLSVGKLNFAIDLELL